MHLCKKNFRMTLHSADSKIFVKVRTGSRKMARNEQVCVHQKKEVNFPKSFWSSCMQDGP